MNRVITAISFLVILAACGGEYTPKPTGYFRIDLPEKKYTEYDSSCNFIFEYPVYAKILKGEDSINDPCSFNIFFPHLRAMVYLTYRTGKENMKGYIDEAYKFVYKHTIKADAINERLFIDSAKQVFGTLYEIKGNAASSVQFYMTDSTNHFLRGSLYFDVVPNKDSLQPVISFIQEDIIHLIETLRWKK